MEATDQAGSQDSDTCYVVIASSSSDMDDLFQQIQQTDARIQALDPVEIVWDNELAPSVMPSEAPSESHQPSLSVMPSRSPSSKPSSYPSLAPSSSPSSSPSSKPSSYPSLAPSSNPSSQPTQMTCGYLEPCRLKDHRKIPFYPVCLAKYLNGEIVKFRNACLKAKKIKEYGEREDDKGWRFYHCDCCTTGAKPSGFCKDNVFSHH